MSCWCDPIIDNGTVYTDYHMGIGMIFGECVFTPIHKWAFGIGILSLVGYIVAQLPQLWQNYKTKKVEGLSIMFLIVWLAGDVFNFLGCVLTNANANQTIIAVYFLLMDVLMLGQWYYYTRRSRAAKRQVLAPLDGVVVEKNNGTIQSYSMNTILLVAVVAVAALANTTVLVTDNQLLTGQSERPAGMRMCEAEPTKNSTARIFGSIFAWCSGLLYFTSRIPQLVTNEKRKSTEGVSATMFLIFLTSNVAYGLTVLLRPDIDVKSATFWSDKFPFILGSMGTLVFDIYFQIQVFRFRHNKPPAATL